MLSHMMACYSQEGTFWMNGVKLDKEIINRSDTNSEE